MAIFLTISSTPTSFAGGTYGSAATILNTGIWRTTLTPTQASTAYTGGNYRCLIAGPTGGLWFVDATLTFLRSSDDGTVFARALTWTANTPITVTIDTRAGTRGVTISGAATGNGTFTFTDAGPYYVASNTLSIGQFSGAYTFSGTVSSLDDTAGLSRTAALSAAVDATAALTAQRERAAALSAAVGAVADLTIGGTRTVDLSAAVGATAALTLQRSRSAELATAVGATASLSSPTSFGPGASTSAMWLYGHGATSCTAPGGYLPPGGGGADADGRTPVQINTETTGSTFLVTTSRPDSGIANRNITDNKSNTFTQLRSGNYNGIWPLTAEVVVCVAGTGGTDHEFTANGVLNDELTLGVDEIKQCSYVADSATHYRTIGQSQISPAVNLKGPGWVYVDWWGDSAVSGSEGSNWTVTAQDEGATVGSQWQKVDSRIKNHTDGWIQWVRWRRYYATATNGIQLTLASLSPSQGARWFAVALMEANITEATAALSAAVDATAALTATRSRAAALAASIEAAAALAAVRSRTAAVEAAIAATAALTATPQRAAAVIAAVDAAAALTLERSRFVAFTASIDATADLAAVATRSAGLTCAVDAVADLTATAVRSLALASAAGATANLAFVAVRSASLAPSVDATASLAAQRERASALTAGADGAADLTAGAGGGQLDRAAELVVVISGTAALAVERGRTVTLAIVSDVAAALALTRERSIAISAAVGAVASLARGGGPTGSTGSGRATVAVGSNHATVRVG